MSLFLLPRSVGISSKRGLIKKLQINSTFSFIATICGRALGRDMFVGPIHAIGLAPSKLSLQHDGYLTQAFWKMRVQILFRDGNNSSSEAYAIRAHLESVLNQKCARLASSASPPLQVKPYTLPAFCFNYIMLIFFELNLKLYVWTPSRSSAPLV